MNFKVQRSGLGPGEWKTICDNPDEKYVRDVFERQLKYYSIGRFRLLDPDGKILEEKKTSPLFSNN